MVYELNPGFHGKNKPWFYIMAELRQSGLGVLNGIQTGWQQHWLIDRNSSAMRLAFWLQYNLEGFQGTFACIMNYIFKKCWCKHLTMVTFALASGCYFWVGRWFPLSFFSCCMKIILLLKPNAALSINLWKTDSGLK